MLKCPFHEEKEPSLKIYPQTNTFNCFGCKVNGDTIEFIQLKEKCSKHAAILKAKELLAVTTVKDGKALKKATELINPIEITAQQVQTSPQPVALSRKYIYYNQERKYFVLLHLLLNKYHAI